MTKKLYQVFLILLALFASDIFADDLYNNCKSCHLAEYQSWKTSDHANSMAVASTETVLANFDQQEVNHYQQKATFYRENGRFKVRISFSGIINDYQINYTFGHYPLQQYLIEIEDGRFQVLPFAWDSRSKEEGGQRWFHNYSDQQITKKDRLHWKQPLQNWNGMCADCHSDGLKRGYNQQQNSFNSSWKNINVGCYSCHGEMSAHDDMVQEIPSGRWLRKTGQKTASWQGVKRNNQFMDSCFACHSLRAPLTDGFKSNEAFLDQFIPQFLAAPNYYADGQIKEEVYVYGSFLQSKMWAAGVNCSDCHNSHSMELKIKGNELCAQCHDRETYNVTQHHNHKENGEGAQCVNCHMTSNRYMEVDDRRDHSFKIPRPALSMVTNTPNACTVCHDEKSNQWASVQVDKWFDNPTHLTMSKQHLIALNSGQKIKLSDHLKVIENEQLDVISRSTALQLLNSTSGLITANMILSFSRSEEPLIRLAAAQVAESLTIDDKIKILFPLLKDEFKSVRVSAARSLTKRHLSIDQESEFKQAFNEYKHANNINSWRGEGRLNQGVSALKENNVAKAMSAFTASIKIEPYFDMGYVSLAELYRLIQQPDKEHSVFKDGLEKVPHSAILNYSYGLYWVRQKQLNKAIIYIEKAMEFSPNNAQFAYTLILAMDGQGKTTQALIKLRSILENYNDDEKLLELSSYLSKKVASSDK